MPRFRFASLAAVALLALAGCRSAGEFDSTGGLKITRSACPAVAVPAYAGDVTIFSPEQSRDARALDVVATIANIRSTCSEGAENLRVAATFDVQARRSSPSGARQVVLPYFATVMRGGTRIMSKQLGRVALDFADGQYRASTTATATADVARGLAALPADVERKVTKKRRPQDADATVDPMTDPAVRAAVSQASFELLIGFQLTDAQLAYNATR